jgi:hypothetical protein
LSAIIVMQIVNVFLCRSATDRCAPLASSATSALFRAWCWRSP